MISGFASPAGNRPSPSSSSPTTESWHTQNHCRKHSNVFLFLGVLACLVRPCHGVVQFEHFLVYDEWRAARWLWHLMGKRLSWRESMLRTSVCFWVWYVSCFGRASCDLRQDDAVIEVWDGEECTILPRFRRRHCTLGFGRRLDCTASTYRWLLQI